MYEVIVGVIIGGVVLAVMLYLIFGINREPFTAPHKPTRKRAVFSLPWGTDQVPAKYPINPHTGNFLLIIHNSMFDPRKIFGVGSLASEGVANSAEYGTVEILKMEVDGMTGVGKSTIIKQIDAPNKLTIDVDATPTHPLVTLTAMLAPSQDFFTVGTVDLFGSSKPACSMMYAYVAGTQHDETFVLEPKTPMPHQPIILLTGGEMYPHGVNGQVPPIGTLCVA